MKGLDGGAWHLKWTLISCAIVFAGFAELNSVS